MKNNKQKLSTLINKFPLELKTIIKKVYNLINDTKIISMEDVEVNDSEFNKIIELTQKINLGEDITFDIGYRYFRNNKIFLEKGVFVPQYDTEQIIDLVKDKINEGRFLEIGTGSGAIPISLIKETNMTGITIDINSKAIELAKRNLKYNLPQGIEKLEFKLMDIFNHSIDEKFDLLISNPPYIEYNDKNVDEWVKNNQPKEALYAEDDGLAFYKQIFNEVPNILNQNGYIILEIGYNQANKIKDLLKSKIFYEMEVIKDYEKYDRFIVAKYNGK